MQEYPEFLEIHQHIVKTENKHGNFFKYNGLRQIIFEGEAKKY